MGIEGLRAMQEQNGAVVVMQDEKELARFEPIRLEAFAFLDAALKRVSTILEVFPDEPQIKIENKLDQTIRIFNISLIGGANFKAKGRLRVDVNERALLRETDTGVFTDVEAFAIPIPENGLTLKAGKSIDIFVRNGVDATAVAVTVTALLGDYITRGRFIQ